MQSRQGDFLTLMSEVGRFQPLVVMGSEWSDWMKPSDRDRLRND